MKKLLTNMFLRLGLRGAEVTLLNGVAFGFMCTPNFKEWSILIGIFGISLHFFEN